MPLLRAVLLHCDKSQITSGKCLFVVTIYGKAVGPALQSRMLRLQVRTTQSYSLVCDAFYVEMSTIHERAPYIAIILPPCPAELRSSYSYSLSRRRWSICDAPDDASADGIVQVINQMRDHCQLDSLARIEKRVVRVRGPVPASITNSFVATGLGIHNHYIVGFSIFVQVDASDPAETLKPPARPNAAVRSLGCRER